MQFMKLLHNTVRGYKSRNSGISKRLQIIKKDHPDIENTNITEESLDNLESGIVALNKRLEKNHRVADLKKIERKFFRKEPYPNFLTWSEKEQIRFLYNSDSTTWSLDKLSECFPATADIIKKLIKSQWKPMTPQRIVNHDTSVKNNWKAFETGQLKLPHFYNDHIKNFISRAKTVSLPTPDKSLKTYNPLPTSSEFLDIVKDFKEKSSQPHYPNNNECSVINNLTPSHTGETYILKQKSTLPFKHKYYTLQQLKKELSNKIPNRSEIEVKNNDADNLKESLPKVDSELQRKPSTVLSPTLIEKSVTKTTVMNEHIDKVPLKITIPKEKMVNSKTHVYKVNDCYYDCNGEFLYKVPGMA
ncbi:neugrin [Halyomorpha halys]|uniref:neugrin n=1 Tax=Halyomorpha halys TaxID=286706 RepID=UPI0006D4E913|nr:neugrin [Halyomorpha halys]